jgi:hypothetical protein
MVSGVLVNDLELPTAEYYSDKAAEIRLFARYANSPEVARELLELAYLFDRMAAYAGKTDALPGHWISQEKMTFAIRDSISRVWAKVLSSWVRLARIFTSRKKRRVRESAHGADITRHAEDAGQGLGHVAPLRRWPR